MGFFGQGRSTVEWQESRPDVLFYKWKENELKKGSKLIIRPGQKAIFYANGRVEGVFEEPGDYDIYSEIVPFLSTLKGILQLRGDTGLRAEVYFVNAKELLLTTDYPVKTIAVMCGFANDNYFSKYFKNVVGESPSSFREI